MPIILRTRQLIQMMQPDGSFADKEFALIAFVDESGEQYSQINIEASEVEGIAEGAFLAFANGEARRFKVPADHGQVIQRVPSVIELPSE